MSLTTPAKLWILGGSIAVAITAATVIAVALSGAVSPVACPAIGWVNSVDVRVTGEAARVADVAACTEAGCTPSTTADATHPATSRIDDTNWRFFVGMETPKSITVAAFDEAGTTIGQTTVKPRWTRVGGSAVCGGPHATDAVVVRVD